MWHLTTKLNLKLLQHVCNIIISVQKPVVFDCAGKYGAGLALQSLGNCLKILNVKPENVLISNKLG